LSTEGKTLSKQMLTQEGSNSLRKQGEHFFAWFRPLCGKNMVTEALFTSNTAFGTPIAVNSIMEKK
jgi:hypothetical protein